MVTCQQTHSATSASFGGVVGFHDFSMLWDRLLWLDADVKPDGLLSETIRSEPYFS